MAKKRPPTPRERALQRQIDEMTRLAVLAETTIEQRTTVVEQQAREIGGLEADKAILQAMIDTAKAKERAFGDTLDRNDALLRAKEQALDDYAERCHRLTDSLDLAVSTIIALAPLVTPELRCRLQDKKIDDGEPLPYERLAMSAVAALDTWMRRDVPSTRMATQSLLRESAKGGLARRANDVQGQAIEINWGKAVAAATPKGSWS